MLTFALTCVGFYIFTICTQSIHIFPGAFFSLFKSKARSIKDLRHGVESIFLSTPDNKKLELWRLPATGSPYIGIIFHGNGGTLENFFLTQLWFQEMGITSYGFDYRGYGKSTGWPSEKGITIDSDTVWKYIVDREHIQAENIIILGISIGCGAASRVASIHQPKMLVLSSGFINLPQVVKDNPVTKIFAPFVFHKFPTIEYVKELKNTRLILASGLKDTIIKPYHSKYLAAAYQGNNAVTHLECPESGHNGVFYSLRREMQQLVLAITNPRNLNDI